MDNGRQTWRRLKHKKEMAQKRICECCGVEYYPCSSAQKYCVSCRLVGNHIALRSNPNRRSKMKPTKKADKNENNSN